MRRLMIFAATALTGVMLAAVATARTAPVAASAGTPTVKVVHTELGSILETGAGYTVYEFTSDSRDKDVCATRRNCLSSWPALTVKSKPIAGSGVDARLLGTIRLAHGVTQVTYSGHPLYRYDLDSRGSTDYVGVKQFGGYWYALSATARTVR